MHNFNVETGTLTLQKERARRPVRLRLAERPQNLMLALPRSRRFVIARVLGHVDSSMTGIYDRHAYAAEKRRALEALARKVGEIISQPEIDRVVVLRQAS